MDEAVTVAVAVEVEAEAGDEVNKHLRSFTTIPCAFRAVCNRSLAPHTKTRSGLWYHKKEEEDWSSEVTTYTHHTSFQLPGCFPMNGLQQFRELKPCREGAAIP